MPIRSRVSSLLRNILRRRWVEQDLDEEIRSYVDLLVDEKRTANRRRPASRGGCRAIHDADALQSAGR